MGRGASQGTAEELAKEGLVRKACSALIAEPPAPVDRKVLKEMCAKHPGPRANETTRCESLREISPCCGRTGLGRGHGDGSEALP